MLLHAWGVLCVYMGASVLPWPYAAYHGWEVRQIRPSSLNAAPRQRHLPTTPPTPLYAVAPLSMFRSHCLSPYANAHQSSFIALLGKIIRFTAVASLYAGVIVLIVSIITLRKEKEIFV
jgi:hypothetical protein